MCIKPVIDSSHWKGKYVCVELQLIGYIVLFFKLYLHVIPITKCLLYVRLSLY